MRYKDTWQFGMLIANNERDAKYNLVSIWESEKPILKRYGLSFSLILTSYYIILNLY